MPKHGDRVYEDTLCNAQNCTEELLKIYDYVKGKYEKISLWACSLGAFFSLLAYQCVKFNQCLFLSPVVDMQRLIENMMIWFEINEEKLKEQKMIETPIGETLYYDYYCYVKEHSVTEWNSQTMILYGENDNLCEYEYIKKFASHFNCDLKIMENGEHFFHLKNQLEFYQNWLEEKVK